MLKYIGKRILLFIPTLFIITLLGFVISVNAPGDPVEKMLTAANSSGDLSSQNAALQEQKKLWRKKLGLDIPVFYFSISDFASPDTLYKIYNQSEKTALKRLLHQYGNWNTISTYYISAKHLHTLLAKEKAKATDTSGFSDLLSNLIAESNSLSASWDRTLLEAKLQTLEKGIAAINNIELQQQFVIVKHNYDLVTQLTENWKNYIPVIHLHGVQNQYHRWLFGDGEFSRGLLRMDFGTSYSTKLPINTVISSKIGWSLFFSLFSLFLAYAISIPAGVWSASRKNSLFDRSTTLIMFLLYSMPVFFVAFLLMLFFSNPNMLSVFPASGIRPPEGYPDGSSLWGKISLTLPYLIMPLFCYVYGSFAFLTRLMRGSMLEILEQDYIRTARAKGLSEQTVLWKHALRNSLLPVITVFANVFPAAIGGSVIIESIFTIPGMGYEVFTAISGQDYPMIIAVMTLTGILTLIGFLVSDILYAIVDPRISYKA